MWRLGLRLTTPSCKKVLVKETATKTTKSLHADVPRSSNRMTASGETTGVKLEVMSAKAKTRIGFWNVRPMYETGKLAQVTTEADKGQSQNIYEIRKNVFKIRKNISNRNVFWTSSLKSLSNLKNYYKS